MTLYRVRQSVVPVMRDNGTAGAGGRLGSLPGGNCAAALDQSGAAAGRYYCVGRSSRNRSGSNRRIASVFLRFLIIRIVELRHAAFIACMVDGLNRDFFVIGPGVKFCVSDFRQSQEWRWKAGRILA